MVDKFPSVQNHLVLRVSDFSLFSESYGKILKKKIPVSCEVSFFIDAQVFADMFSPGEDNRTSLSMFQKIQLGEQLFAVYSGVILLPFMVKDGCVVAAISDTEPIFHQKVDSAWLFEMVEAAKREYILLKEARVDMQTGLLNLSNLYSLIDNVTSDEYLSLILVELTPKRFSYQHIQRHVTNCTTLLRYFLKDISGLHYLGHCTFGLVLNEHRNYGKNEVESSLTNYLRREGCHRVAIGSSNSSLSGPASEGANNVSLLDEAWTAVCHAKKLGPFSFCNYQILKYPEQHLLALPDRNLVRRLSRLWSQVDSFHLVQFEIEGENIDEDILVSLLDQGDSIIDSGTTFLFIRSADTQDVLQWLTGVLELGIEKTGGKKIKAGVAVYPFLDFTKSEVVLNGKKALLHASYYDDSCAVLFDSVSLNISGDVFFGDGNLIKAAKEYRRGLKCDNQDVNLHNSLGVTLAQMDKLQAAYESFQAALTIDSQNSMSLYNLGLLEQKRNHKKTALEFFRKAQIHYNSEESGKELLHDLELQLGILSCEEGEYLAATESLTIWFENNKQVLNSGRVYYFLGMAYHGLNNNQKAMEYLQKSLQFDEFDARAMSLLGYVYAKEKQGDDIALSLCQKSMELDPGNIYYKLQFARVCKLTGNYQEAKDNVSACLRIKKTKAQAQFLLGEIYAEMGQVRRAKTWFEKVKLQTITSEELYAEANQRLQQLNS